jgi:hypothetical protein
MRQPPHAECLSSGSRTGGGKEKKISPRAGEGKRSISPRAGEGKRSISPREGGNGAAAPGNSNGNGASRETAKPSAAGVARVTGAAGVKVLRVGGAEAKVREAIERGRHASAGAAKAEEAKAEPKVRGRGAATFQPKQPSPKVHVSDEPPVPAKVIVKRGRGDATFQRNPVPAEPAEPARVIPEKARVNPEKARVNPEKARVNTEKARVNPEEGKKVVRGRGAATSQHERRTETAATQPARVSETRATERKHGAAPPDDGAPALTSSGPARTVRGRGSVTPSEERSSR